jgi:UDP-glucose 6-dehydrogenase
MTKVKIYGMGWVGKAMLTLFPDAIVVDPALGKTSDEVADIAFVCVPTPCPNEGALDTSIVEDVVKNAKDKLLVIRSTVNPGFCDMMSRDYKKDIVMQPEYLGETVNHPMTDQKSRPFLIIGGEPYDRRVLIELYQTVYNANITIRQVTALEAEIIKLTENRAIAFKVAQCQELYDVCERAGVDYYTIRDAVYSDDPRFNLWWTFVFPDKRGFNSKCIPKDVYAWCAFAESLGYKPEVTRALLERNKKWLSMNSQ